jgi:hypothetical protein
VGSTQLVSLSGNCTARESPSYPINKRLRKPRAIYKLCDKKNLMALEVEEALNIDALGTNPDYLTEDFQ